MVVTTVIDRDKSDDGGSLGRDDLRSRRRFIVSFPVRGVSGNNDDYDDTLVLNIDYLSLIPLRSSSSICSLSLSCGPIS